MILDLCTSSLLLDLVTTFRAGWAVASPNFIAIGSEVFAAPARGLSPAETTLLPHALNNAKDTSSYAAGLFQRVLDLH